jgi:hypothetical protein
MRGAFAAVLACACIAAAASPSAPPAPVEMAGLRSIAGWLKAQGAEGYLAAEVADAIGIPRGAGVELLVTRQRGFRDAEVLRIAQIVEGDYLLFMVQSPGEVVFYLSTVRDGLRKALVSLPAREAVAPLGGAEAETNFRREVLYWEDKVAR